MSLGKFVVENSIAQQEHYDDIATCCGWTGTKPNLDAEGASILDEEGNLTTVSESAQDYMANRIYDVVLAWVANSCYAQQVLQGTLHYDANYMINLFKGTTTSKWVANEV